MGIIKPLYPVQSNMPLELNRDNPFEWTYTQGLGRKFAFGTDAWLTFQNSYGQTIATWEVQDIANGDLHFFAEKDAANLIPAGTNWTLTVDLNDGNSPRLYMQGTVIRAEAPFPNAPGLNVNPAVQYSYSFGTPGFLYDPAWRIISGRPYVYDNSGAGLPNAVAGGSLLTTGEFLPFVFMLYYAPLMTDNVRFTYQTVGSGQGVAAVILTSSYDARNFVSVSHANIGGGSVSIRTGTGVGSVGDVQASVTRATAHETFTASYNGASNTYAVYAGTNTTPIVSWTDNSDFMPHGPGQRYIGLAFQSELFSPGVEICNWYAGDDIGAN